MWREEVCGRLGPRYIEVNVHRMVIENEGIVELGSDHNLIWCVVGQSKEEKVIQEERYKWKVDGRQALYWMVSSQGHGLRLSLVTTVK